MKTSWRYLCKTSWRCLEDVLKTYGQDEYIGLDQDVLKTSSEDVRLRQAYSSSEDEDERRLQDVFINTNVCWAVATSLVTDDSINIYFWCCRPNLVLQQKWRCLNTTASICNIGQICKMGTVISIVYEKRCVKYFDRNRWQKISTHFKVSINL